MVTRLTTISSSALFLRATTFRNWLKSVNSKLFVLGDRFLVRIRNRKKQKKHYERQKLKKAQNAD